MNKTREYPPPHPCDSPRCACSSFVLLGLYPLAVKNVMLDVGLLVDINSEDAGDLGRSLIIACKMDSRFNAPLSSKILDVKCE